MKQRALKWLPDTAVNDTSSFVRTIKEEINARALTEDAYDVPLLDMREPSGEVNIVGEI